ncbi:hypothetical protein N8456_01380 [Porticoccaceae bacterium]|nr:hypothetical protein [Porticoccaceae bacterium]
MSRTKASSYVKKLLIANRGEIAIRIARTAHTLGLATVAIYSSDDAHSLHVTYADESIELPGSGVAAYLDIDAVITAALADIDSWLEIRKEFAAGMITGLLRIEGRPIGIIANNPMHLGGAIDARASEKASEFIRLCERFKLPILSLCDTPGFMVGPESEREGAVRWACNFVGAGAQTTVPYLALCVRKGFGLGAQAMVGGSFATTQLTAAWPNATFGMMGIEGGVELGYKKELEAETDLDKRQALFNKLVERAYEQGSAESVASLMELDAVIDPLESRSWIVNSLVLAG